MSNRIMLNQTSYHGAGAVREIPGEVKARGFKKALVVCGPSILKHGVVANVTDQLDAEGLAYEIYSDIKANPTIENVQAGVAAFKAAGADYIIAIGGGSPMDTAKAIGIIVANPEFADVRSLEGVAPTKNPCAPIIAVPTTAGTAAEVTINYVITDVERRRKFVCVDAHDMPICRRRRPRDDELHAQGPHRQHRHGRPDPRHRGLHHQGRLGDDRYVPSQGHRAHSQEPPRRRRRHPRRPRGHGPRPVHRRHGLLATSASASPTAWPTPSAPSTTRRTASPAR